MITCSCETRGRPMSFAVAFSCATPSLLLDLWQTAMRSFTVYFEEDSEITQLPWDDKVAAYWADL
jgi:hypothetical protein